jgi:hypothetical protein
MFKRRLHKLLKIGLALIATVTFSNAAHAEALYETLLKSCGPQMNSLPVDAAMPLGRRAGVVHPRNVSLTGIEACADLTWVKVLGQVSVAGIQRAGKLPVAAGDCAHSTISWALYKKTSSGGTFIHGGSSYGSWKNNQCVYDGTAFPTTGNWGDMVAGTGNGSIQEYRIGFLVWQHDDPNIGHNADYCADPQECAMPARIYFNGPFKAPKTDYVVYRTGSGTWWVSDSTTGAQTSQQWGLSQDVPVAGDYDGDFKTDFAVWRPSNGTWYVIRSSNGTTFEQQWGLISDIPVPADYDGDGKTDIAIWRPSSGQWWIIQSKTGAVLDPPPVWGQKGDQPVPALFDDDLRADLAYWRKGTPATWKILSSLNGSTRTAQWGNTGDIPLPGSYTSSDYLAQPAVWTPSSGKWQIGHPSGSWWFSWGSSSDVPLRADFDSDGVLDYTYWRPSNGKWYHRFSSNGAQSSAQWGASGDVPVAPFYSGAH